jgi:hypothetical protein
MKRVYFFIPGLVILTLVAGASAAQAQRQTPAGSIQTQSAAPADLTFTRLFLLDPMTSHPWRQSHTIVDGSGGVHLTFYDYDYIYYAHCAADCGNPASWLELPLFAVGDFDSLDEPTLSVDASGRPRLMWFAAYGWGEDSYYYAECNANCTASSANWTSTVVVQVDSYGYPHHVRYAALDTQDRPHLVHPKTDYPDYGFNYLSCDAGCATASNWYTTTVVTPGLEPDALQLVFDPNGRPRVLGYDYNNDGLFYAECNSNCSNAANWGSIGQIAPIYYFSDNNFVLRVDAQGRPRIAYYDGNSANNLLNYAWSNASPLTVGGWSSYTLNYPSRDNWTLDLALDSQGRPSVAYSTAVIENQPDGLAYLTCTAGCETASPTWQSQFIETTDDLDASYPIATTPGCVSSAWMVEGYPALALNAAGSPSVAYSVRHAQFCYDYQGHLQMLFDAESVRFATAGGGIIPPNPTPTPPPSDLPYRVSLPLVTR